MLNARQSDALHACPGAQAPPQWPQLNFNVAALLAREFRAAVDRARAKRLAAVHARLQRGTARGFHAVRTTPPEANMPDQAPVPSGQCRDWGSRCHAGLCWVCPGLQA